MTTIRLSFFFLSLAALWLIHLGALTYLHPAEQPIMVEATTKTDDVEAFGDAADDSCTYINEKSPKKSLVIGTDKKTGISVYDLDGERIQTFPDGKLNNIDIRYDFEIDDDDVPLICSGNRSTNTIDFYYVDEEENQVERLSVGEHSVPVPVYGLCMYQDHDTEKSYVFVTNKEGIVIQYQIRAHNEKIQLSKVREFDVGSQIEGCVVDDDLKRFYVGEEKVGIWQYGADPESGESRKQIDHVGADGHLVADVEGLTLYRIGDDDGYLLASSQGENAYNIYERESGNYVGKFRVRYQGKFVENTDGIDATSHRLGRDFPRGLLVVQDGNESNERQSYKYVSWEKIATSFTPPLKMGRKDPIID